MALKDRAGGSWRPVCAALTIPLTAILHHLVFDHHRCILETHGRDYTPAAVKDLFLHDPSLPWAIAIMVLVYHLGKRSAGVRRLVAPALAASIPAVIWLWDIPFTGRTICRHYHDGKLAAQTGLPLGTGSVYAACLLLWVVLQIVSTRRRGAMR